MHMLQTVNTLLYYMYHSIADCSLLFIFVCFSVCYILNSCLMQVLQTVNTLLYYMYRSIVDCNLLFIFVYFSVCYILAAHQKTKPAHRNRFDAQDKRSATSHKRILVWPWSTLALVWVHRRRAVVGKPRPQTTHLRRDYSEHMWKV